MPVWTARVAAPIFGRCMDLVVFLMEGGAEKAFQAKRIGEANDEVEFKDHKMGKSRRIDDIDIAKK